MRIERLVGATTVVLMTVAVASALAQAPLNATLRCRAGSPCSTGDVIVADGVTEGGFDFAGFHTTSIAGKGKQSTVYLDGAFVNDQGGIDINLASQTVDRSLVFRFGVPTWTDSALPAACQVAGKTIAATDVDFRFTVFNAGTAVGIDALAPGSMLGGLPDGSGLNVGGVVNFAVSPDAEGALFFNFSKDSVSPWDGQITLSRSADGSTYVLTSTSSVLLQCTTSGKGKHVTSNATYSVPFVLTVQR
jgi:hypothetical protein